MAVGGISTLALFQTTLGNVNTIENNLSQEQIQLSSGSKSQNYQGIAAQAQNFISINSTMARNTQYLSDNSVVETRIDSTSSALDQIVTVATGLESLISQQRTGVTGNSGFSTQLQGLWQQLTGQLNIEVNGRYLFSGSKTNVPAVNDTDYPTNIQLGVPDDSYYQGNQQDVTVTAQDGTQVSYNVRADNPGFQKLFASLATAMQGGTQNSDSLLKTAQDLVTSALKDITATQATVNATKVQMTTIDQNLTNSNLYLKGVQESIGNTDIVSVSTQVAINQGILQAAFQAFAKISSLQLSNFLK